MRTVKQIFHFLLVAAVLTVGIPSYHQGDANRDSQVDLADAILRVQELVRSAEEPATFRESLENALVTMSAVAGFTKVMKADRGQATRSQSYGPQVFGPIASLESGTLPPSALPGSERSFLYQSIDLIPITPPPVSAV